ncbi:MAG: formimidoylglutamate deiminase, partial [Actinobacteria bacterium]|nr:formimidoylglutamate deiminase [Actinomycetota bacterium]
MSATFHAEWAWRGGEGVVAGVRFAVRDGRIEDVAEGAAAQPGDERIRGVVLPGLVNAHSHAFHRALRGRTHAGTGDFWTWREQMYGVANRLDPDSYRELATCTFAEMALAGITGVGEFHYVHHPAGGGRYADPNEMGRSIVEAGAAAGVRVALLDVAYLHASLASSDPLPEQRRFSDDTIDAWLGRVELLGSGGDGWTVGLAPHSVRAVRPAELAEVARHRGGRVVHLHVSEQPAENEACLAATGL